jgi:hypothetical protein
MVAFTKNKIKYNFWMLFSVFYGGVLLVFSA